MDAIMNHNTASQSLVNRPEHIYRLYRNRISADDEYSDWADYREMLTDFILHNTRTDKSLIIYGAGKCNDLNLGELSRHFKVITLSDYLPGAVQKAIERYHLKWSDRLKYEERDYTGISDETYIDFTVWLLQQTELLLQKKKVEVKTALGDLYGRIEKKLVGIYQDNELYEIPFNDTSYDYAIVVGVHSQLNNSFSGLCQYLLKDILENNQKGVWSEGDLYNTWCEIERVVSQVTKRYTGSIVRRFNEAVFARTRTGVIYGYEENMEEKSADGRIMISTVSGAAEAGEITGHAKTVNQIHCVWPLSKKRQIRFNMCIRYLQL